LAALLSAVLAFSPLQPVWAQVLEAGPPAGQLSAQASAALELPPAEAIEKLETLAPTDATASTLAGLASLSEIPTERLVSAFGAQDAVRIERSLRSWTEAAAKDARTAERLRSLQRGHAEREQRTLAAVSRALIEDLIRKFAAGSDIRKLGPSEEEVLAETRSWDDKTLSQGPLGSLLGKVVDRFHPAEDASSRRQKTDEALGWFREKYGVLDRPLLAETDPGTRGSYRAPGAVRFAVAAPALPKLFEPASPSSIQDLDGYIARKWGGLGAVAEPSRVIFSELGTTDTMAGLKAQGFERFRLVNAPYATRGSKTLLATKPGEASPYVVFYSFVGKDLFDHKLMQLSLQFGDRFGQVRVLGSNNLKSWDVADLVVARAVKSLPPIPIDDVVVGYPGAVEAPLAKNGKLLDTRRVGDFATVKYFEVTGKNGMTRTVALLTDIELRYFGKSVLALVKPFLDRGVDRVIFAGSAGSLDPSVPLHGLILPRSFHLLNADGTVSSRSVDNDLFDLLPYGVGWSGRHLSVSSPLLETKAMVKRLREKDQVLSVDVEGAQIAELIRKHNETHGTRIRYGAAFIVTDTPVAEGEAAKAGYGLHQPDFKGKNEAKKNYAAALDLLWDQPGRFVPSNHTRLIGRYYAGRIQDLAKKGDSVGLAAMYTEIRTRLDGVRRLSRDDRRVSRGLAKTYLDLLRTLDKAGASPLPGNYAPRRQPETRLEPISRPLQRIVLLQSLTRSSTLNSGETNRPGETDAVRRKALANAERAVEYVLARSEWPLDLSDYRKLNAILNEGLLPDEDLGKIRDFSYQQEDGKTVTSAQELEAFADWIGSVVPTPEAALEAYLRLEQLHPAKDGNGKAAELMAQHLMLRASGHPFLFPNRFDIDYILSLRRNGSHPASDAKQLGRLLAQSAEFSAWLRSSVPGIDESDARIDPDTGLVAIEAGGRRWNLRPLFKSPERISLEREQREFLPPGQAFPAGSLVQKRTGYEAAFALDSRVAPLPASAAETDEDGGFLNFGGSFSPPTLEHMGLMAHIMHRLGLTRGKMVVALPYKKGAATADVPLDLTNVAVENFREVLGVNSIPYKGFSSWTGGSSWKVDGRRYSLAVETYDIRTQNKENTLQTLEYLRAAHGGNAKANWWISGADSFGSVPTWTPRWRELFAHTNWVVVSRPGFSGPGMVDFSKRDPLRGVLEDAFLADYEYSFDAARQMHAYRHRDPSKPGIFIIDQPTLGDSSTNNRKSLAEDGDHEHAQAGLQPSVFRRCLEKGYFGGTGYTDRNLEGALSYLHSRIENPDGDPLPEQQREDYEKLTRLFIDSAKAEARTADARPWYRKGAAAVWDHVTETVEAVTSLRRFNEKLKSIVKKMGQVGAVYFIGEIIEQLLMPPLFYLIAGPAGLAFSQVFHVNEFVVMPAFIAWTIWRMHQRRKKLGGGDFNLYWKLRGYLNRLLRGDPEVIVAQVELGDGLGLAGGPVTLNIVKSQLPKIVPLWIRRLFDRRIVWHDLNVSTNELKAILQDKTLAKILEEKSDGNTGLYAYRLASAVMMDPSASLRFKLFLSQRYFRRLSLGDAPLELLGGFAPAEREALKTLKAQMEPYRNALEPAQLARFSDAVGDVYALAQAMRGDPKEAALRARDDAFWTAFLDLMVTRYPDERLSLKSPSTRRELAERLPLLARMAEGLMPEVFDGAAITYRGRELFRFDAKGGDPWKDAKAGAAAHGRAIDNYVAHYVQTNRSLFLAPAGAPSEPAGLRLNETFARGEGTTQGNLIWEMDQLETHVRRERETLAEAYDRAERVLEKRMPCPEAEKLFWKARRSVEKELDALKLDALSLEYGWLRLKFPHQLGPGSDDETRIDGYQDAAGRYAALRGRVESRLEALRALNHMMLGTIPADVSKPAALSAAIQRRTARP
jgi:nicotinic acid mononucleotide adenylyltransferase